MFSPFLIFRILSVLRRLPMRFRLLLAIQTLPSSSVDPDPSSPCASPQHHRSLCGAFLAAPASNTVSTPASSSARAPVLCILRDGTVFDQPRSLATACLRAPPCSPRSASPPASTPSLIFVRLCTFHVFNAIHSSSPAFERAPPRSSASRSYSEVRPRQRSRGGQISVHENDLIH